MPEPAAQPIRDAATVILMREGADGPEVLMGRRGAAASFMPSKYVFPGGAVDTGDAEIPLARPLDEACADALGHKANALAACAVRELWEETGQILGRPDNWLDAGPGWRGFAATGHRPDGGALRFVFRAVTPPGQSRRFDARFFLAEARHLASNPDDFTRAEDELQHLHWVSLRETHRLDLPQITTLVLDEVEARLREPGRARDIPFFQGTQESRAWRDR